MSFVAPRMNRIKPSPSTMATMRVRELQLAGRKVIGLTIGEPDFDTPPNIIDASIRALKAGQTRYTNVDGTPELKDAVALKFQRENGLTYARDEITCANGSKQVIFNALMATVTAGDEVIVPAPYYVSYPDMVLLAGGTPVAVECTEANGFKLQAADLESAITPRTKWLMLNSPCNPTGAVYTAADLKPLTAVLMRHPHVWVLTDEVYEHIVYGGMQSATPAQVEPALLTRTLTVNGVSKAYAMTGFRIGYAGGPAQLIKTIMKMQSQSTTNPSSISQAAAVEALTGPQNFLAERARNFRERRDLVVGMLNEAAGITCRTPEGAFYVFANVAGVIGKRTPQGKVIANDLDFVMYLLDSAEVGVLQGAAYGMSPYIRLSYSTSTEKLKEACSRIQRACAELLPAGGA
ncbi:MAG: pyridoxal phosphate-dependent aminotransferase [Burkholderiales bacterium]